MVKFELTKDENILFEVRKHNFILLIEFISLSLMALIPLVLLIVLDSFSISLIIDGNLTGFFIFAYSFWLFILWNIGFVFWTNHYLDVWIVTNKRIIDIEQKGLFNREISTLYMDRIQDVTSDIIGFIPTLIGFGDITVQTAGEKREFIMKNVRNPNDCRDKLSECVVKFREKKI